MADSRVYLDDGSIMWNVQIESTCTQQNLIDAGATKVLFFWPEVGWARIGHQDSLFNLKVEKDEGFTGIISASQFVEDPKGQSMSEYVSQMTDPPETEYGHNPIDYNAFNENYQWALMAIGGVSLNGTPGQIYNAPTWELNYAADDPLEGGGVVLGLLTAGLPSHWDGTSLMFHPSFHWYNGVGPTKVMQADDPILTEAWGSTHADGGVLCYNCYYEQQGWAQVAQSSYYCDRDPEKNDHTGTDALGIVCSDAVGTPDISGSSFASKKPTFGSALGGTWTWDGTLTVVSTDTSGVSVGDFIVKATTEVVFWEILSIVANTSVTVKAEAGHTPPTGSGAYKVTNPPTYNASTDTMDGYVKGRMRGIAPAAKVVCLSMARPDGSVATSTVPIALKRAIDFNCHVVVVPGSGIYYSDFALWQQAEAAVKKLREEGILVVAPSSYGGVDWDLTKQGGFTLTYSSQKGDPLVVNGTGPRDYSPTFVDTINDKGIEVFMPTPETPKTKQYNLDRMTQNLFPLFWIYHFAINTNTSGNFFDICAPGGSIAGALGSDTAANNAIYTTATTPGSLDNFPGVYGDKFGPHGLMAWGGHAAIWTVGAVAALMQEANYRKNTAYLTGKALKGKIKKTADDRVGPEVDDVFISVMETKLGKYNQVIEQGSYKNMELVWKVGGGFWQNWASQGIIVSSVYNNILRFTAEQYHLIFAEDESMDIPGKDPWYAWGRLNAKDGIDDIIV